MNNICTVLSALILLAATPVAAVAHLRHDETPHAQVRSFILVQAVDVSARAGLIIASQLQLYSPALDPSSTFKTLGADDLDMVEITLALEDEFDIVIPDDEVDKVKTVDDYTKLIEKILAAKPV